MKDSGTIQTLTNKESGTNAKREEGVTQGAEEQDSSIMEEEDEEMPMTAHKDNKSQQIVSQHLEAHGAKIPQFNYKKQPIAVKYNPLDTN